MILSKPSPSQLEGLDLLFGNFDDLSLCTPLLIFDVEIVALLDEWSKEIFAHPLSRNYPDVISFGYWIRKSSISEVARGYLECPLLRMGRGLSFHIAPSNVPVNFAFSAVFGLLAGNSSLVRVPSRRYPQIDIIIEALGKVKHPRKKCILFFRSSRDAEILRYASSVANCRLIWGGDETISKIRSLPSSTRSIDLSFSDRYSFLLLKSSSIVSASDSDLVVIAKNFFNDVFLFDQNACSSPRLIYWLGSHQETESAKIRFWESVNLQVSQRYENQEMFSVEKFKVLLRAAAWDISVKDWVKFESGVDAFSVELVTDSLLRLDNHFGLFPQYSSMSLDSLWQLSKDAVQTCTYFGFEKEEITEIARYFSKHGIDRWVKMGEALNIHEVWDGYDLPVLLSRAIEIK